MSRKPEVPAHRISSAITHAQNCPRMKAERKARACCPRPGGINGKQSGEGCYHGSFEGIRGTC